MKARANKTTIKNLQPFKYSKNFRHRTVIKKVKVIGLITVVKKKKKSNKAKITVHIKYTSQILENDKFNNNLS